MDTDYTAQSVLTTVDYNQETAAVFPSKSGYMLYVVLRVAQGQAKGHKYTSNYSREHCLHFALPSEPTFLIV